MALLPLAALVASEAVSTAAVTGLSSTPAKEIAGNRSHHTLFEGNYTFNMDSDTTHDNSVYLTFFRNYATGYRSRFTDCVNHNAVVDDINNLPGRNGEPRPP